MYRTLFFALGLLVAAPALAQVRDPQAGIGDEEEIEQPPAPLRPVQPGRVADSAAGEIGQRRTRDQIDGVSPLARINSRVQNRVQSRIRNRIDRNYDPQANTTSPFAIAEEQTRTAGGADR